MHALAPTVCSGEPHITEPIEPETRESTVMLLLPKPSIVPQIIESTALPSMCVFVYICECSGSTCHDVVVFQLKHT